MDQRIPVPAIGEESQIPGGWFTVTVLLILLAVAVASPSASHASTLRTNRGGDSQLFGAAQLTAAQHRATAEGLCSGRELGCSDPPPAAGSGSPVRGDRRAQPGPGPHRQRAGPRRRRALPDLADELSQAATAFNDVTYGERPGTQAAYQMIADLDDHLRSRSAGAPSTGAHPVPADSWAQVR